MAATLVIGGSGQLGQALNAVALRHGFDSLIYPDRQDADILHVQKLEALFIRHNPPYVVNCAAYTAVDKAEDELEAAHAVNCLGAANLARLCAQYNACLIHISTDFVFRGDTPSWLTEEDETAPIGIYGRTKLQGEQMVQQILPAHFILRTSWLYSEFANNFVKTMLKLAASRSEVNIIADQTGTPTYTPDLAAAIIHIIQSDSRAYGLYHYSNEGSASWYDFAVNIFQLAGVTIRVNPIKTSDYPARATRPKFSVLDKAKIKSALALQIPYWRDSLVTCIKALQL